MVKNKPTLFERFKTSIGLQEKTDSIQNEQIKRVQIHTEPVATSGTEIYSGYFYEDYLQSLQGTQRADFFDKMRRSDPKIKMLISAVKNPIKAATYIIEPASDDAQDQIIAELVEHCLFSDMDKPWTDFLHEALSLIDFGHSAFEMVDKVVIGHKKFGSYTGIKTLGFRSQRVIERWNLDQKTGELLSISIQSNGDLQSYVDIPSEFLLLFVSEKEGDNYEGISFLRSCIGAFKRKDHHLKAEAIGIEKYAVPTPVLDVPPGKEESSELATAKLIMQKYVTHQQQYITKPQEWKIDFIKTDFDAAKIRESINAENTEMVNAFLANFLDLGTNGAGSYALSFDLSDFFLTSIEHIANKICEEINRTLIKRLVNLNFGPQEKYPQLKALGITEKAGKELADIVKALIDSKAIIPDDKLEADLRKRYKLPVASTEGQREIQKPQSSFVPMSEREVKKDLKLAEPKKQIKQDKIVIEELMQKHLSSISSALIKQIMTAYKNLPESKKLDAIKGLTDSGVSEYKKELIDELAKVSFSAIEQARKEVPKAKNVRLTEKLGSVTLAEFEKLSPELQRLLKARSDLLVGAQLNDLKKAVFFAYTNSVFSTDSETQLQFDLDEEATKYVMGPASSLGAANVTSQIVNESRNAFFFDDEVSKEIESFMFVNADPVSPICQDLNGTVFSKDDPNLDRYWPPLHHNCKSYIVPNLVGNKNPDLTQGGIKPSKASLEKFITLSEASGISLQAVLVSKELVKTMAEAIELAKNYQCDTTNQEELETGYKFKNLDSSLFNDGTLQSYSPIKGVTLYIGILKPAQVVEFAESKWSIQSIVVSKDKAKSIEEAKKIANKVGADTTAKVDETDSSFRFRQNEPENYVEFRTKAIPEKGVSLIYGRRK